MLGEDGLMIAEVAVHEPLNELVALRIEAPFRTSTADRVSESVTLRDRLRGGGRSRQTATVTARRTVDAAGVESWSGTFKTRVALTHHDGTFGAISK